MRTLGAGVPGEQGKLSVRECCWLPAEILSVVLKIAVYSRIGK